MVGTRSFKTLRYCDAQMFLPIHLPNPFNCIHTVKTFTTTLHQKINYRFVPPLRLYHSKCNTKTLYYVPKWLCIILQAIRFCFLCPLFLWKVWKSFQNSHHNEQFCSRMYLIVCSSGIFLFWRNHFSRDYPVLSLLSRFMCRKFWQYVVLAPQCYAFSKRYVSPEDLAIFEATGLCARNSARY